MDKELLKIIIIAAVAIALGGPTLVLAFRGRLAGITAGKDGVKLDLVTRIDARDEAKHYMDERIKAIDDDLKTETRDITQALGRPIRRALSGSGLCTPALNSSAQELRGPVYHAVNENDFKHHLALHSRQTYLDGKLAALADEYAQLVEDVSGDPCAAGPSATITFPTWSQLEPAMSRMLTTWGQEIAEAVIKACRRKIAVYAEYRLQFAAAGDEHYVKVVDECTAKNLGYIAALGGDA